MNAVRDKEIARNVALHDKVARKYEKLHGEIFNPEEQQRLADFLRRARDAIESGSQPYRALDFGCGSGNLSRHLLALGFEVTAADVSRGFLDLVMERYGGSGLVTYHMPGGDASGLPEGGFDLVATYSVLHHIPDYLAAVDLFARLCRPGGVIVIDHEKAERFWRNDPLLAEFESKARRPDLAKYLDPMNYVHRVRRIFNPRHSNEGDIHVWPDDHIEWPKIKNLLGERGFEIVAEEEFLLAHRLYRPEVYEAYRDRVADTKAMIFRKRA